MGSKKKTTTIPFLEDWHLWSKVTSSISPLKKSSFDKNKGLLLNIQTEKKLPKNKISEKKYKGWTPSYTPVFSSPKISSSSIEPRLHRRLARGKIAIDATIDLHDLRQDEAQSALVRFLSVAYSRQSRTVLVITGKGKKTNENQIYGLSSNKGILRTMLPIWLKGASLSQIVMGYEVAAQAHGGDGAFYVRLRRQKK